MTTFTSPVVDLAEEAFYDRAVRDEDLMDLLNDSLEDERIVRGRRAEVFDVEEPEARHFPLLTYFGVTWVGFGGGFGNTLVQTDIFGWPYGESGGVERMGAIEGALIRLFDRTAWTYDGRRYFCFETSGRRGGTDRLLHRVRQHRVRVGGEVPG